MSTYSRYAYALGIPFIFFTFFMLSCQQEDDDQAQPAAAPEIKNNSPQLDTSSFIDTRDSTRYRTIKIGNQNWMAEDLKYLPEVVSPDSGSRTKAFYYVYGYNGNSVSEAKATDNYKTYGVLYNWTAAMDNNPPMPVGNVQGACPDGWHLPSNAEWIELVDYLGGRPVAGGKMKSTDTSYWRSPNVGATNESGFNALPAGNRTNQGIFEFMGENVIWWTSTPVALNSAYIRNVYYNYQDIYRIDLDKELGFCVRCVEDGASGEGG